LFFIVQIELLLLQIHVSWRTLNATKNSGCGPKSKAVKSYIMY